jgi:hypothetical protein
MVSLIRNSSRTLFLSTSNKEALSDYICSNFEADKVDAQRVLDRSSEYQTVVFLADAFDVNNLNSDQVDSYVVYEESLSFTCALMTSTAKDHVLDIRPGAQMIIMRSVGDIVKVLDRIHEDFGGRIVSYEDYLSELSSSATFISLTEKPLNRNVEVSDLKPGFLRLEGDFGIIKRDLRMHALKYLNIGIGNRDWNEVEIRIYDKYGAYKLHYDRLIEVFEDLELGLVLGESWSKDYPKAMLAVEIYRVRLLTFHDPIKIKRLLFGLEYLPDGTRIVDYDLYIGNDKVAWNKNIKNRKRSDRYKEALLARQEVFEKLNPETIKHLEKYEAEIGKNRY